MRLGVEDPFRPSGKAHPAFVMAGLDEPAERIGAERLSVWWDEELAPWRRFYGEDPFGNRLEFIEP